MVYQVIQLVGAVVILVAYALQSLKRLHAETLLYQTLNLIGGILLCTAAVAGRQYGFILLEGSWSLLSAYGVVRLMRAA
jgi:hypothetical protein